MNIDERITALSDVDRDRVIMLKRELTKRFNGAKVNFRWVGMVNGLLDKALSKDGRNAFYSWAFDRPLTSSHDLLVVEMFALVLWAGPQKSAYAGQGWTFSKKCIADLSILIKLFSGGVGQPSLPMDEPAKPFDAEKALHELGF